MIYRTMKWAVALLLTNLPFGRTIAQSSDLMLNEVMQSNIDYLLVEKDFPDSWVELYNPTDVDVNLSGYRLGEHADGHNAYQFPRNCGTVPAKGHLVVYCDKENRGLHASFRIDSGKASVYLFNPAGETVDSLLLSKMPAPNIAFGRVTDGSKEWQYEVTPTTGMANQSVGSDLLLPEPEFSVTGGVFKESFHLTLSLPETAGLPEDTKLYYTKDGKEPSLASDCTAEPLTMEIGRTTVIRAKLMSANALSPVSSVQSYIFHPRETNLPIVSIVTDNDYIFGNEMGIASSMVQDGRPNYMQSWRRPVNVEYYDMREDGQLVFNQLGETAVSGVSTREQPQKSFKIYANKRFGKKTYKGDFWTDKPEVTKVKSFVLRSGGNNSFTTRINDALVQKVWGTHIENLDWQAYQPVIVYINGVYRGEAGMRERSNEDFVEANHDIEEVEMADETAYQQAEAGSLFEQFRKAYRSKSTTYEQLKEMMDMDNFTKALLAEMYAMNTDFPTNNVSMWRPLEEGGRWRWVLKDLDRAGMNLALYPSDFNMYNYLFDPDPLMYSGMYHFDLYAKMASLPEFQGPFVDQMMVYLGDFLKPALVCALADSMSNDIYNELKYTFQAYNCTSDWSRYKQNMQSLKNFFTNRPANLYRQTAAFFNLGNVIPMTTTTAVGNKDDDTEGKAGEIAGKVSINGISLTEGDFQGSCFSARPVTLDSGSDQLGWRLTVKPRLGEASEYTFDQPVITILPGDYAKATNDTLSFETYVLENPDSPEEDALTAPTSSRTQEFYSLTGIRKAAAGKGLTLSKVGNKYKKVVY